MIQIMVPKIKHFLTLFSTGIIAKIFKRKIKGIIFIKQYVFKIYKLMKEFHSKDKKDA